MICLDANVFVSAARSSEPGHAASFALVQRLRTEGLRSCSPVLVLAEVAGALARRTGDVGEGRRWTGVVRTFPGLTLLPLDAALADRAAALAAAHRLRGADAVYAATAAHLGAALVTWDAEVIRRLAGALSARTPAAWLTEQTS